MDDARYGRVFEVSVRGARSPEATGTPSGELAGRVEVRLLERAAPTVTWDLGDRAQLREVDFRPRMCVPLRPPGKLEIPGAELGTTLVVRAGIADFRSRRANRAIATLRVLVDGVEVARAEVGNESGWLALPVAATIPGTHTVAFEATTGGSPASLDLCVAAEARR
jgi:hypothetical protein